MDLSPVQEEFQGVITAGMKVLVAALETRCAPSLKAMTQGKWAELDELGEDSSPYMLDLVATLRELMPQLGEALHPLYVRFFCDKFVASFVPRLIGTIYRCRRIGETGGQQLQLDVGTLKQTLLDLPTLGQANATNAYTRLVTAEVHKAEQLLKLIQTPEELLETTIEEMGKEKVCSSNHPRTLPEAASRLLAEPVPRCGLHTGRHGHHHRPAEDPRAQGAQEGRDGPDARRDEGRGRDDVGARGRQEHQEAAQPRLVTSRCRGAKRIASR